ncbi:MAG: efflux RND transporter permease subunit [Planctomycetota bacterium]|jgi:predicted RND superfamily exporter protein
MTHFLEKKDPWGHGMGLWVLVLMAALMPPSIWALSKIDMDNDIRKWVPSDDPNTVALNWYQDHFPHNESVLVSWDGSSLNDPRVTWLHDRLAGVADEEGVLHGGSRYVARVVTPQSILRRIEEENVPHEEALARLQGVLIGTGPLKLQLTELGTERKRSTLKAIEDRLAAELGLTVDVLEPATEWLPEKSIDEYPIAQQIMEDAVEPEPFPQLVEHDAQIRWEGMHSGSEQSEQVIALIESLTVDGKADGQQLVESVFFAPGSPLTVAVVLNEAGEEDKKLAIAEVRQVAMELGIPDEALHLGGRPVAGAAVNASVKQAGWNRNFPVWNLPRRSIVLFSGLVGIVLAFVMLRSGALAGLVLFVSYYTVIVTTSTVPVSGGSMNMVLVVMPTLLLVLTISGAIHVANYWKHALHSHSGRAPIAAAVMAARPCFLASLTTAFGLLSLTTSPLKPVSDFGMYSALGCFAGLGAILYALPALLLYLPQKAEAQNTVIGNQWPAVGRRISRHPVAVTTVCLLAFAACSVGLKNFDTETKVIRFFPDDSRIVKDYHWLEENIGGIIPVDVVVRFSEESRAPFEGGRLFAERQEVVRRIQRRLVAEHPDVTGALSLATFRTETSQEDLQRQVTSPFLRRMDTTTEQKILENESAANFIRLASDATALTLPDNEAKSQTPFQRVAADLGLGSRSKFRTVPISDTDELWRITAQVNIMTDCDYSVLTREIDDIVRSETKSVAGSNHVVTGMVPLFLETQQAILTSLIKSFLIAFVVIGAVISWVLKSIRAGLITMLPNVLPISTVFGAISWYGIKVDIGTMITASVALGIAVDGTLHLLTWFRENARKGLSQTESVAQALGHCGPALCQTSIVVGTGLLVLLPAELSLISRFGWLMAAMIGTALIADLVLLPALLCWKLGEMIIRVDAAAREIASTTSSDMPEGGTAAPEADRAGASTCAAPAVPEAEPVATSSTDETDKQGPPSPHMLRPDEQRSQPEQSQQDVT